MLEDVSDPRRVLGGGWKEHCKGVVVVSAVDVDVAGARVLVLEL
jgi:hypothetical protein